MGLQPRAASRVYHSSIGRRAGASIRRIAKAWNACSLSLDDVGLDRHHLDHGGQAARAVPFLERAAAVAARVSANEEAIRCLTHALELVATLPEGRDRDAHELSLRSTLSVALNTARGYAAPEVEANLDRVFTLTRADGDGTVPVRWLWVAMTLPSCSALSGRAGLCGRGDRDPTPRAARGTSAVGACC